MKKADNFDASKWLVENKITTQSRLNEGIVSAPLSNFLWKLNPKVKEWENISSTKEALSFIKSLTNEELNNLYVWRLGFDIPQSEDEKIKNLLDLIDNKIGESKLNEAEENEIEVSFKTSPEMLPWNAIEKAYQNSGLTGEEFFADVEDEFREKFEGKPVSKEAYYKFFTEQPNAEGQGDLYTMVNWINLTNPALADKLYSMI